MSHLSEDRVYDLAVKVSEERAFDREDVENIRHIAQCEDCYQLLCCMMAMQKAALHVGEIAVNTHAAEKAVDFKATADAVFRLVVRTVQPVLEQVEAELDRWRFGPPLVFAGARHARMEDGPEFCVLEDEDTGRTKVVYNPESRQLHVKLDVRGGESPAAMLRCPDGTQRPLYLRQDHNGYLQGVVDDLEDGEYEILLRK